MLPIPTIREEGRQDARGDRACWAAGAGLSPRKHSCDYAPCDSGQDGQVAMSCVVVEGKLVATRYDADGESVRATGDDVYSLYRHRAQRLS